MEEKSLIRINVKKPLYAAFLMALLFCSTIHYKPVQVYVRINSTTTHFLALGFYVFLCRQIKLVCD